MKWKWNPYPLIMSAVLMNSFFPPVIFSPVLSSSLPIMIHCLLTKNIQPRAVRGSVALSDKPRCWFWGQRRRMRAEKLKREACEVLRFRSHKYPQEEKPRQSTCDTSAETRRQTRRGGRELITQQSSSPIYSWGTVRSDWGHGGCLGGEKEARWEGERRASGLPNPPQQHSSLSPLLLQTACKSGHQRDTEQDLNICDIAAFIHLLIRQLFGIFTCCRLEKFHESAQTRWPRHGSSCSVRRISGTQHWRHVPARSTGFMKSATTTNVYSICLASPCVLSVALF